jgi:hypothetical protein
MRPLQDVRGQDVFVVQALCGDAHASANDKLCRLLFFIATLKDAGAARVTACLPYLAYARKDRRTQLRDPVTTRYVAALFDAVNADRVVVLDVHNEAAFDNAFRCETIRVEAAEIFAEYLAKRAEASRIVVASPDIGGVKRAHEQSRSACTHASPRLRSFPATVPVPRILGAAAAKDDKSMDGRSDREGLYMDSKAFLPVLRPVAHESKTTTVGQIESARWWPLLLLFSIFCVISSCERKIPEPGEPIIEPQERNATPDDRTRSQGDPGADR